MRSGMSNNTELDDEDQLAVPAGNIRVIVGLVVMVSGLFIAVFSNPAFSNNAFGIGLGLLLFLISPFIMLTTKKKEE
jgi:hypothetical protein